MRPFRHFCNVILPTVYDDALSYLEQLSMVVKKLNEVIETENAQNSELNMLAGELSLLQTKVEKLYTSPEMQSAINDALDNMASSGEFDRIISAYASTILGVQQGVHYDAQLSIPVTGSWLQGACFVGNNLVVACKTSNDYGASTQIKTIDISTMTVIGDTNVGDVGHANSLTVKNGELLISKTFEFDGSASKVIYKMPVSALSEAAYTPDSFAIPWGVNGLFWGDNKWVMYGVNDIFNFIRVCDENFNIIKDVPFTVVTNSPVSITFDGKTWTTAWYNFDRSSKTYAYQGYTLFDRNFTQLTTTVFPSDLPAEIEAMCSTDSGDLYGVFADGTGHKLIRFHISNNELGESDINSRKVYHPNILFNADFLNPYNPTGFSMTDVSGNGYIMPGIRSAISSNIETGKIEISDVGLSISGNKGAASGGGCSIVMWLDNQAMVNGIYTLTIDCDITGELLFTVSHGGITTNEVNKVFHKGDLKNGKIIWSFTARKGAGNIAVRIGANCTATYQSSSVLLRAVKIESGYASTYDKIDRFDGAINASLRNQYYVPYIAKSNYGFITRGKIKNNKLVVWFDSLPDGSLNPFIHDGVNIRVNAEDTNANLGTITVTNIGGSTLHGDRGSWFNLDYTGTINDLTDKNVYFTGANNKNAGFYVMR